MTALRRSLQVFALVGTLLVGILALALIVSQTPWFRDWMRRYIVRESKQYLNGELSIGRIGGNLLFGVEVSDIAVDVSGERVVAARSLVVDYSVFEIISRGVVINEIKLVEPMVKVVRDAEGWNLARLVKPQAQEADREGPGTPISLPSIEIADGRVTIEDGAPAEAFRLPERIDDLDLKASFGYEPVHYSVAIERAAFRASSPELQLTSLDGKLAVRDDTLFVETLSLRTGESHLTVDGSVENYPDTPRLAVTTGGTVSLPEIGRVIPAAAEYALHPAFDVKASGPLAQLGLDLDVKTEAGSVRGQLMTDLEGPDLAVRGPLNIERLDLAPILNDRDQASDLTGRAELDLKLATEPASTPFLERAAGTFGFAGSSVVAAGYRARDVAVTGSLEGGRIDIDGRARAYGGTATARGFILPPAGSRALAFDLRGRADNVDLRGLPPGIGAPKIETDLSVAEYHVKGSGGSISGTARLNESTVEGASIATGTAAEFSVSPGGIQYAARGSVSDVNLPRMGKALEVTALANPAYDGVVNGEFDVTGSMPPAGRLPRGESSLAAMTVRATGTLRDSSIMGGRLPEVGYDVRLAGGGLDADVKGRFEGFDPETLSGRKEIKGSVSGAVDVRARVADITGPITPEDVTADGTVTLEGAEVGGLKIDTARLAGQFANRSADITRLELAGPDLKVAASGRLALDRTSASDLKYHVEATNLAQLATLAGQSDVSGAATIDGVVRGNAASLRTTGTLDGSNLGYGANTALDLNSEFGVTIPDLTFTQAAVDATTKASFLKVGGLQINTLTATTTYAADRVTFTTTIQEEKRELAATGEVILHTDHQELHLPDLAVRTQGVEWRTAPALPGLPADSAAAGQVATIKYGQNRVELENVRLVSGDQAIEVSGAFALNEDAPAGTIEAKAANVDLQQLETIMLMDRGLGGKLSATATISGTAKTPAVKGHVEIAAGSFQNYKYDSLVADVDYSGTRVGLDARLDQSPGQGLTAQGTLPTSLFAPGTGAHVEPTADDRVDLHVKTTTLDLGLIQGFTNQVTNVAGTLEADVRVTGAGADPHVTGFVDIKGGAFGVPAAGVSYTGLNTRIELQAEKAVIQDFALLDEEGASLKVSGELAVHAARIGAVNVNIAADGFEVIDNELGDVGIDAEIAITGELRRPAVQGSIRLQAARLEVDRILALFYDPYSVEELPPVVSAEGTLEGESAQEATATALRRAETTAVLPAAQADPAAPPAESAMDPVSLDMRLVIPDNLVLRGKSLRPGGPTGAAVGDINITVGGDLQIVKPAGGQLLLLGTIQTVRGTYTFQGRRFDLARGGTVRFLGEPQPNPSLDIVATRVIPNTGVEVSVGVRGTAKAPQLELTSTPPLEESDILALIVFNRPVNELGTGERASLAATAGGIATGFLAAPLGESIGRALDLDLFEITTTTEEGDLGAGLTVGQQIGDRAFFKLRQQFGERNVTEFLLEYQLTDFFRAQATAAPETSGSANRIGQRRIERAGIDLIFFFSY
jgi:translocation and assembly module TamB